MKVIIYALWVITGTFLALIILKTQHWSVKIIDPENVRLSIWLVIGGAVVRWGIIFSVLISALSYSISALLLVFSSLMVARIVILFKWQSLLIFDQKQIH